MTKPDKPDKPKPEAVDFELVVVRTEPARPGRRDTLVHITCEVCGGTADSRDREPVMRAAKVHARDDHGGRTAHIRQ